MSRRGGSTIALLFLLFSLPLLAAEESAKASLPKVEAAFLRNFTHYIDWPATAFASDQAPWRICVLGKDPFGAVLDDTFRGRTERGRGFEIVRVETTAALDACQMVYVSYQGSERRQAALAELTNRPVLTVGDAPEFLQEGGMIRFQVSDHVEFGVNLDRTRSASLKVQTKMLEVAHEVLENGTVRRRR